MLTGIVPVGLVDQLKIYDEAVNAEVVAQLSAEGAG